MRMRGLRRSSSRRRRPCRSSTSLETENARLKSLLEVARRYPSAAVAVEVLYTGRDPFSQKLFVNKGTDASVKAG